ncbi:MAG: hypothetical protein Q9163_005139 [Psora crenata]
MALFTPDNKSKPSALRSIIAGSTAGAVEIAITYPAECMSILTPQSAGDRPVNLDRLVAKTRTQLNRRLPEGQKLGWPPFGKAWYAGCTTLMIGNSLKAGIRFVAFDQYKTLLQDEAGRISGPRTVIAGFGAGITESLLAVTPFESIKTTLIDDRKSSNPRMRGFLHGSSLMFRERGVQAFFQGFVPTTARQAANSATRFGSYTAIKQFAQGYVAPGERLGTISTFGIGGLAGLITVATVGKIDPERRNRLHHSLFACAAILYYLDVLHAPPQNPTAKDTRMAWFSSGSTNAALITNLAKNGLISSDRVKKAMLAVRLPHSTLPAKPPTTKFPPHLGKEKKERKRKEKKSKNTNVLLPTHKQVDRTHYSPISPYEDSPQPIGYGATISAPHMHAAACESLLPYLQPSARVLDIGSGSGYLTAVLANLVGEQGKVVGVDHIQALVDLATTNMAKSEQGRLWLESGKVRFVQGDGRLGFRDPDIAAAKGSREEAGEVANEEEQWDAIHVGAAAKEAHEVLIRQLRRPGRLFIPVGEGMQYIWIIDKAADGQVTRRRDMGNLQTGGPPGGSYVPELFRKENQLPGSLQDENIHLFGSSDVEGARDDYFGGPILEKTVLKWRGTHYTRASGEVIGATECGVPLPFNMSQIVRSVAVMSSAANNMCQTAIWIGPRLLLSTLHFHHWIQGLPSNEECDLVRKSGRTFDVESEIASQVLSSVHSPKVVLLDFSVEDDIGIFKLPDRYPPRSEWVDPDWLTERDELYNNQNLGPGRKVACVGYSGKINDEDKTKIKNEAAIQLRKNLPQSGYLAEPIDLDLVTKPQMKSFAPGTLDQADANDKRTILGVSASLWKGSSGGPCVLLDGSGAGAVIGLVRGYDVVSDPYNLVNGFPVGLKAAIKHI